MSEKTQVAVAVVVAIVSAFMAVVGLLIAIAPGTVSPMVKQWLEGHALLVWLVIGIAFLVSVSGTLFAIYRTKRPALRTIVRWLDFSLSTTSDWTEIVFGPGIRVIKGRYEAITLKGIHSPGSYRWIRNETQFNVGRPAEPKLDDSCAELLVHFKAKCEITSRVARFSIRKGDLGIAQLEVADLMELKDFSLHKVLAKARNTNKASSPNELSLPLDFSYLNWE